MSIKVKKLSYKYEYLKLELEELQAEIDEATIHFNKLFGKYMLDKSAEMWVNEETGEIRKELPSNLEKPKKSLPPKKIKKLYKKLTTFCHPDKGGTQEDFLEVKLAYEDSNYLELVKFASKYDIEIDLEEEDFEIINKSIENIDKKINTYQDTLVYGFFNGPPQKRIGIIKEIERIYKVTFTEKQFKKFLDYTK